MNLSEKFHREGGNAPVLSDTHGTAVFDERECEVLWSSLNAIQAKSDEDTAVLASIQIKLNRAIQVAKQKEGMTHGR